MPAFSTTSASVPDSSIPPPLEQEKPARQKKTTRGRRGPNSDTWDLYARFQRDPARFSWKQMKKLMMRLKRLSEKHQSGFEERDIARAKDEAFPMLFMRALALDQQYPGKYNIPVYAYAQAVTFHGDAGRLEEALAVFERLRDKPGVGLTPTSVPCVIRALSTNGRADAAKVLYEEECMKLECFTEPYKFPALMKELIVMYGVLKDVDKCLELIDEAVAGGARIDKLMFEACFEGLIESRDADGIMRMAEEMWPRMRFNQPPVQLIVALVQALGDREDYIQQLRDLYTRQGELESVSPVILSQNIVNCAGRLDSGGVLKWTTELATNKQVPSFIAFRYVIDRFSRSKDPSHSMLVVRYFELFSKTPGYAARPRFGEAVGQVVSAVCRNPGYFAEKRRVEPADYVDALLGHYPNVKLFSSASHMFFVTYWKQHGSSACLDLIRDDSPVPHLSRAITWSKQTVSFFCDKLAKEDDEEGIWMFLKVVPRETIAIVPYTSLLNLYVRRGNMRQAEELLAQVPEDELDGIFLGALIQAYIQRHDLPRARALYDWMHDELKLNGDTHFYNTMLEALRFTDQPAMEKVLAQMLHLKQPRSLASYVSMIRSFIDSKDADKVRLYLKRMQIDLNKGPSALSWHLQKEIKQLGISI